MVTISQDGEDVVFRFESGIPHKDGGNSSFSARFTVGKDYGAFLLAEHLRDRFTNLVKSIREEEYHQGWKDAKAKKGSKRAWFAASLKRCWTK